MAFAACGDEEKAATPPATTATAASISDDELIATAREHAETRMDQTTPREQTTLLRSDRDPRWALVSGGDGRELWAVWLRDGEIAVAARDPEHFDPRAVPCDLRPAFSEPSC